MIKRITDKVATKFRTFGGEIEDSCNPIDVACEGEAPFFALGVDVNEVVVAVLEESGHAQLLAACEDGLSQLAKLLDFSENEFPNETWDEEREAIHTLQEAIEAAKGVG